LDPTIPFIFIFLTLIGIGVPIAICMGVTALGVAWYMDLGVQMFSYNFFANIAKFPLLAIPFFILAGILMERSGIAERLVTFIRECMGSITGGMAIAAVTVTTFWGALSGSGPATVAALGVILIPGMVRAGYDKAFSTAVISVSSGLAIIIPPSIGFIIYAVLTSVSVGGMFAAGIIPGIVMALCLIVSIFFTSRKRGWRGEPRRQNLLKSMLKAGWALCSPVIILGGIYGGIFTPTEAAAVAVFYSLFVGVFVYRKIGPRELYEILRSTVASSGIVMLLITCGGLYAWVSSTIGMIDRLSGMIMGLSDKGWVVMIVINIMLLIMGMLIDGASLYYVFTPVLWPVIQHFGWDPVWFGVVMTMNIAIGGVTPPVAGNLFLGARIAGLTMEEVTPWIIPLVIASVVSLIIVCAFPATATFLPRLWGLM
jgi:C4-dicarboxylate transporter DctM subunit